MKKIQALLLTGLIVGATASGSFINANAALTPPQLGGSNIAFRNDGNNGQWGYYFDNINYPGGPDTITYYTRTQDGIYWNYTNTTNIGGLTITQTYNRSNTGWIAYQGGPTYQPYLTNIIGSNNTVGTIANKIYLELDNQTNKDYYLYLDLTSFATTFVSLSYTLNNDNYFTYLDYIRSYTDVGAQFITFPIPSYSNVVIGTPATSATRYFDAFYLDELGTSAAWINGYGNGESDVLSALNGGNVFSMIRTAFESVRVVFDIRVLPNISLGLVIGAFIMIKILFNFLGILNGTPQGGKK